MHTPHTPPERITACNDAPIRAAGSYVLYWMIACRRARWSFALQHAVAQARALGRALLVFEPLRVGYPWASARHHRFILDGMADNARAFAAAGVAWLPWVEATPGQGAGLLQALARDACLVVTDRAPGFFLHRMVAAAAAQLPVRLEQVDGGGLLPLDEPGRAFTTAHALRRHLQKRLRPHLAAFPLADPLRGLDLPRLAAPPDPARLNPRWASPTADLLHDRSAEALEALPIDLGVPIVEGLPGGAAEAERRLAAFLTARLDRYAEDRNAVEDDASSGLSPYLHFGHISAHQIVKAVLDREGWSEERLSADTSGRREGWWGVSAAAEAFLDQIVTWRELGALHAARHPDDHDRFERLPAWAQQTLDEHALDPRPWRYELDALDEARTHDPLWNAAQRQLRQEGTIHNVLRMLWGKKVLEWAPEPRVALDWLVELNNRYALDGRDPNSSAGILWVFGLFDRAWGPERPIFGKVRYMSSKNMTLKRDVRAYLERYGAAGQGGGALGRGRDRPTEGLDSAGDPH